MLVALSGKFAKGFGMGIPCTGYRFE